MAVQAQLYNTGNNAFPPFQSTESSGYNGGFDQFCNNLQPKQQVQQAKDQIQWQFMDDRSQAMVSYMEKQRQELDQYIASQNDRLRFLLQDQRSTLLRRIEAKASILFRRKDEEILRASNRAMELENLLNKLEAESYTWQRLARENEATVVSLSNTLERMREAATASCRREDGAEDAASFCEAQNSVMSGCRRCGGFGGLCVVFLPCRHLCCCGNCEAFLDCCPVCGTAKKGSIEALF